MPATRVSTSTEDFIRARFVLEPLPFYPEIALYHPTPQSGLHRWLQEGGRGATPPYWAYPWAGGAALALYLKSHPLEVAGHTVLDFGAGSGLVAIAAARAGARVTACEPDPIGQAAIALNAEANDVALSVTAAPIGAEIVLAGDVFYDGRVAAQTLPILQAMAQTGSRVLVGDPFRPDLPRAALDLLAEFEVPDMGSIAPIRAGVFSLGAA